MPDSQLGLGRRLHYYVEAGLYAAWLLAFPRNSDRTRWRTTAAKPIQAAETESLSSAG